MLPDISVVICAYTEARWQALLAAVESIRHQSLQPRELILVIDHNPSLAALARSSLSDAIVVENGQPIGISGARNAGIAKSSGQIVAFLDDDAFAEPDWLNQLVHAYDDAAVMGVGGRLAPFWESPQPTWFPPEFGWVVGCSYTGLPRSTGAVRNLIGANMSIRRDVLEILGGFREDFGKKGLTSEPEDTDFCIRGSRHWPQRVWLYEPAAIVYHRIPASRARLSYFVWRCYLEGRGKASLVQNVGRRDGLAAEGSYVVHTLPSAIARGLMETLRGDVTGLARSAAISLGLSVAVAAYLLGRMRRTLRWGGADRAKDPVAA